MAREFMSDEAVEEEILRLQASPRGELEEIGAMLYDGE